MNEMKKDQASVRRTQRLGGAERRAFSRNEARNLWSIVTVALMFLPVYVVWALPHDVAKQQWELDPKIHYRSSTQTVPPVSSASSPGGAGAAGIAHPDGVAAHERVQR